ncbi:MAG: MarR family transcriptional regulator [Acidimicrobiales bacterium]|nr:MarR family transcriptional regulator [Acidimicrobiales bacterium]MBO0886045.1 MarR family transcriptional regulator [Acidimicrobiales bacterium]MBO0894822.1 MarR family transcriptional regulator [Acidimicrobiales bacterium]
MTTVTTGSDGALASSLRISVMRLARRLRAQRSDDALTLSQVSVLATLERYGPLTPTDVAEHEKVQPPSITRVLAALEERGLVTRQAHPKDRRQAVVALSETGSAMMKNDRKRRDAWLSKRLVELGPEEQAILTQAAPLLEQLAGARDERVGPERTASPGARPHRS